MARRPGSHHIPLLLNGSPVYAGTITATTTSQTNGTTAVPFKEGSDDNLSGKVVLISADVDCVFLPVAAEGTAVTAGEGVDLVASDRIIFVMPPTKGFIAARANTGTVNLKVHLLE